MLKLINFVKFDCSINQKNQSMRFLIFFCLFFTLVIAAFSQGSGTRIKAANNKLSIALPEGFNSTKSSNGFINPKSASSILLFHFENVGYLQYLDSLNQAFFEKQNLVVTKRYTLKEPEQYGEVFECNYIVDTILFNRVFFVTGTDEETIFFLINYPTAMQPEMKGTVLETIRSIKNE